MDITSVCYITLQDFRFKEVMYFIVSLVDICDDNDGYDDDGGIDNHGDDVC